VKSEKKKPKVGKAGKKKSLRMDSMMENILYSHSPPKSGVSGSNIIKTRSQRLFLIPVFLS
jgi:hypothetical protein